MINTSTWTQQYVTPRDEWIVAADIGQSVDPTAVCALQHIVRGTGRMVPHEASKTLRQERVETFHIRHLERLPLGMAYPTQIQHVANLLGREPLVGAKLVIDYTGVGRPVFDMFDRAGLRPHGVLITAGNETTSNGNIFHVPKQTLISQLEARLHSGELKIAADIADAPALRDELKDFARAVSAAGRVSFNARSGSHDDLVLAVAIGLFLALGMNRSSISELIL
ncbi:MULTISPECIES: hypothetical protein [Rhodopseudomonas]|uniref:Terminase large subunit gp17-like C-terminal domain-containing protein n=1 Tax=Rhodopseudomonas palustris TaxID=1076 RepID=A0A0D7EC31_RHOPL|nr:MULTISPECIES: hypothetical protein [Rhodopseudomonas]KIZ38075.1 hypothetical protein OO17_23160 [Rhodopseudomonas palustris]MDF3810548.1 hypothetical protein [Rhodopseudomonas sp. BAL398]WOK20585.1 hypothetical protein RBJ75_02350 [Rhodopseudomonas sp. BAL398]